MSETHAMRDLRDRLILAALPHVPFDGWSRRVLREAAKSLDFDETMGERAFPGGAVAAIEHLGELADRRMAEAAAAADLASMRLTERVAWLTRRRIEAWADHREAVRRAVTLLSLPTNGAAAMRTTWRTVDAIWFAAGDASADFGYYTKRAGLVAVYTATLLYWLEDESDGFADSWAFMRRRLDEVSSLPKMREAVRQRVGSLPNPLRFLAEKMPARRHFGVSRR